MLQRRVLGVILGCAAGAGTRLAALGWLATHTASRRCITHALLPPLHCEAASETQATLALQGGHSRSRVDVSLHTSYGVCTGVYPADQLPFFSFETYALFSLP